MKTLGKRLKVTSLGSGSKGNALIVSASSFASHTHVLIDCGFSLREMTRRLLRVGLEPSDLSHILITHEHSDHAQSVFQFATRYQIPVSMSYGTFLALEGSGDLDVSFRRDGDRFEIGNLEIKAFTVSHDAKEPLHYTVSDGIYKCGVLTDTGQVTPHLEGVLKACDVLVLEANHDVKMLEKSSYPYSLKKRILSEYGHLSNEEARAFIESLDQSRLQAIVGAHLSQENNDPLLVAQMLKEATAKSDAKTFVASQEEGFDWIVLE